MKKNEEIARFNFSQFIYSNNNKPAFKFLEKYFFGIHVYKVYIKSPFQPHNTCYYQQYMSTNYIDLINATWANNGHKKSNLIPSLPQFKTAPLIFTLQ